MVAADREGAHRAGARRTAQIEFEAFEHHLHAPGDQVLGSRAAPPL